MNEHQRRAQELAEGRRRFLTALSAGQVGVNDRFGNRVEVGQKLLIHSPVDLIFDVTSIAPILDPHAPPGLLTVTVSISAPFNQFSMQANQPWQHAIIIGVPDATPKTDPEKTNAVETSRPTLVHAGEGSQAEGAPGLQADGADGDRADPSPGPGRET